MKFDQAFYQFVMALVAIVVWCVLVVTGKAEDAKEFTFILNALIGAGIWGGIQKRIEIGKNDSVTKTGNTVR